MSSDWEDEDGYWLDEDWENETGLPALSPFAQLGVPPGLNVALQTLQSAARSWLLAADRAAGGTQHQRRQQRTQPVQPSCRAAGLIRSSPIPLHCPRYLAIFLCVRTCVAAAWGRRQLWRSRLHMQPPTPEQGTRAAACQHQSSPIVRTLQGSARQQESSLTLG